MCYASVRGLERTQSYANAKFYLFRPEVITLKAIVVRYVQRSMYGSAAARRCTCFRLSTPMG